MRHAAQTVEQAPVNSALLNVVTPMGLSFEKNRLSIGENIGKAYGIIRGGYARSEGGKRVQESLPPCGERSQCNEMQDAGNSKFAERGFYALIAHISESCQDGEHPAKSRSLFHLCGRISLCQQRLQ